MGLTEGAKLVVISKRRLHHAAVANSEATMNFKRPVRYALLQRELAGLNLWLDVSG
jgi:hypothetical protein